MHDFIHVIQMSFTHERPIMDNIFFFMEVIVVAHNRQEALAILLLDFEKVYDQGDWDFLHGTLLRPSFLRNEC